MAPADFTKALQAARLIDLTVTGRRSGRQLTYPVNFVLEGDTLYLLPVRGSDTQWYKNVLENPTIRLAADGAERDATARPITDPDRVREIVDRFRAKYGDAGMRYYAKLDVAVEVPLA